MKIRCCDGVKLESVSLILGSIPCAAGHYPDMDLGVATRHLVYKSAHGDYRPFASFQKQHVVFPAVVAFMCTKRFPHHRPALCREHLDPQSYVAPRPHRGPHAHKFPHEARKP